jgi:hypothetical protein
MRLHQNQLLVAFGMLLAAWAAQAHAQINLPFGPEPYSHDFQLFAPAEIDLDNEPAQDNYGYWAGYEKLSWTYTGERTTIGSPDVVELAEIIYYQNDDDLGVAPSPHIIQNTLTNAGPKAGFAFGDRYEFGYRNRGNGWTIGILDGPAQSQFEFYGFAPRADGGVPPFIDPDYTSNSDIGPGPNGAPQANLDLRAFGWGSVPVLFETPANYLMGFRDYLNFLGGASLGTQGGPLLYVGNYGATQEPDVDDDTIPFFRLADDLNENGIPGASFIVVDDVIVAFITDFDDLHQFNIFFDNVSVRTRTQTSGVEAMWSHELTNRHYMAKHQNNRVTLSYGARFFRLKDQFDVNAQGSILGQSSWNTTFTNQIVGPQVGASWTNQRQRWMVEADTRFLFGYNVADWTQDGLMGEELIPGALNRPLYARPTAFDHGLQETGFSPVAELRLRASYFLTKAVALNVGYTGMYVGNIHRAATSVRYSLPDMGYSKAGTQEVLVNGVDVGIEFVY